MKSDADWIAKANLDFGGRRRIKRRLMTWVFENSLLVPGEDSLPVFLRRLLS
jgi:hypothetical protein